MNRRTQAAGGGRTRGTAKAPSPSAIPEPAWPGGGPMPIAVGVSGAGSNLRALAAAIDRGEVPARIALVFADRACRSGYRNVIEFHW